MTETAPRRRVRVRRWLLRSVALVVLGVAAYVGGKVVTGNFAAVKDGEVYRSAQMSPGGLDRTIRQYRIKTVLNLRGPNPESSWYRREREVTLGAGATLVDIAMSSCQWMSREQLRTLVDVLRTAERPILLHCYRGAERTGLASAFARLLEDGSTLEQAREEFALRHLFVRAGDGILMPEHLDQYERWLASHDVQHSPATFLRWVESDEDGFRPGTPGREQWPYDPYPLVVIHRPPAAALAVGDGISKELGARR